MMVMVTSTAMARVRCGDLFEIGGRESARIHGQWPKPQPRQHRFLHPGGGQAISAIEPLLSNKLAFGVSLYGGLTEIMTLYGGLTEIMTLYMVSALSCSRAVGVTRLLVVADWRGGEGAQDGDGIARATTRVRTEAVLFTVDTALVTVAVAVVVAVTVAGSRVPACEGNDLKAPSLALALTLALTSILPCPDTHPPPALALTRRFGGRHRGRQSCPRMYGRGVRCRVGRLA